MLSTDIAESSLTVSGVRIVVDAGLARVPRHDLGTGMTRLTTISTSRASADQRAGRAGRTEPGVAYRLWSKLEHATRRAHLEAEITQVDLAGVALELAAWGTPVADLRFIDPPPPRAHAAGARTVAQPRRDRRRRRTDADRPVDAGTAAAPAPRPDGRRRAEPTEGLACVIAAILDERDVLRGRADELPADLALRVRVVCGHDHHERADRRDVARVRDRARPTSPGAADVHLDFDDDRRRTRRRGAGSGLPRPRRHSPPTAGPVPAAHGHGCVGCGRPTPSPTSGSSSPPTSTATAAAPACASARASTPTELIAALGDDVERQRELVWDKQRDDLVAA